jgi:hypothetical protein
MGKDILKDSKEQTEIPVNGPDPGRPYKISIDSFNYEDILAPIFESRKFLINEHWDDPSINIPSRIIEIDQKTVVCECLIDEEKNIFETRKFPRLLFNNLKELKKHSYALISIKSKVGSMRIDVYEGKNLVDKRRFNLSDEWNQIDFSDLNNSLEGPIKL